MRSLGPFLLLAACGGDSYRLETDAGASGDDAGGGPDGLAEADPLYDPQAFPTFDLEIPDASRQALFDDPRSYQPATFTFEGVSYEVGLRLKGWASMRALDEKAAFKIKFDEYVDGQRFFGLRRLTLNNMVQDPSMVHERIGYWFWREAGLTASRCNSARVNVNGEYWGVYANLETIDDEFAQNRFRSAPGNLYDILDYFVDVVPGSESGYELETNQLAPDTSDLTALIDAANQPAFVPDVEAMLDLDAALTVAAAAAIVSDWDGYFGARNNYKLYHELDRDRFLVLPYGIDQTFSDVAYDVYGSDSNRVNGHLFARCKSDPACLARYEAALESALAVWESLPLIEEMDRVWSQIQASAYEDPRKEASDGDMDAAVDRMRAFLGQRGAEVRAQLDGPLPELCENGVDDDGNGDVDCDDRECEGVCP